MGRMSARSNPTGLKELDRNKISISIYENAGRRSMAVERFDLSGTGLNGGLQMIVVASAGNTNVRHHLGVAATPNKAPLSIDGLDRSRPIRFRVLLHEEGNPKLVASIENIRPRDDAQSESLLPMEAADLGEQLWKVVLSPEGAVLQFNSRVFPSAAGAENYVPFNAFVLPEALRQVAAYIADQPGCLEDEDDPWFAWGGWIDAMGIDRPAEGLDHDEKRVWCDSVAYRFANKFGFASKLNDELQKATGND